MKSPVWQKAVKSSPDPPRAKHFLELLAATTAGTALQKFSAEQARILAALFSGSHVLGNLLVAHPDWLDLLGIERLQFPRRKQGLLNETGSWMRPLLEARAYSAALRRLVSPFMM